MTKCSICGKKGLFLKVDGSGRCQDCVRADALRKSIEQDMLNSDPEYARLKESNDTHDRHIKELWEARNRYEQDKSDANLQNVISVYEHVFIDEKSTLNADSHRMYLSNLYIQTKQFDKAWGYLNHLFLSNRNLAGKVRAEQSRILKKEGRYSYAMEMLMISFLYNSKWKNSFDKADFMKKATPIANKLKWDESKIEYLANLIDIQVKHKNYDESALSNHYQKALEQFGS